MAIPIKQINSHSKETASSGAAIAKRSAAAYIREVGKSN